MRELTAALPVFLATLVAFLLLDAAWLALFAIEMFQSNAGPVLRPEPLLTPVVAFYLVYALGIVVLAVNPALDLRSRGVAARRAAMLGLTAYATFDLTNLAMIRGWTATLAVADMAWGVAATTAAALAGYHSGDRLRSKVRVDPGERD